MLRAILDRSRAVIVHSDAVAGVVREHGLRGPMGKIPHGAWIVRAGSHGVPRAAGSG